MGLTCNVLDQLFFRRERSRLRFSSPSSRNRAVCHRLFDSIYFG